MTALLERLEAFLLAFGEPVVLDGFPSHAWVRAVSPAEARVWLPADLVDLSPRPIRGFVLSGGSPVVVGSLVGWQGQDYRVSFVRAHRLAGQELAILAIGWPAPPKP